MRPIFAAALLPFVLAVAAACGGGSGDGGSRPDAVPAGAPFIDQDNLKFIPNTLVVKSGQVIYFGNSETALHTVTINGKNESGTMKRNDIFTWTPGAPGDYKVTCEFHPQMRATITVQ